MNEKKGIHMPDVTPYTDKPTNVSSPNDSRLRPCPSKGHGGSVDTSPHTRRGPYLKGEPSPRPAVFEKQKEV